jgi:transcriptional regulator with XRE-family HTH domain
MELLREFGLLLADRRRAAGLSRLDLAKLAKLSDATIKFVETARHMPSRTTLLCLTGVPQLKLSWADIPFEVGGRTPFHTQKEVGSDAAASVRRSSLAAVTSNLNCYLSPSVEPLRMVMDLHRCLNSSGGFIEPASLYIEHQSAASYLTSHTASPPPPIQRT